MDENTFLEQFTLSKIMKYSGVDPEWVYGHIINIWDKGPYQWDSYIDQYRRIPRLRFLPSGSFIPDN